VLHLVGTLTAWLASAPAEAGNELTAVKAAILGVVEGFSEFLPISSTGHLIVAQSLLGVGESPATKDAADTYTIVIQAGAILAVLLLYWRRVVEMLRGAVGRDPEGRTLLINLVIAFIPAALVGVLLEAPIRDRLFGTWPVIVAWIAGGIVILFFARRLHERGAKTGRALETLTVRGAVIIGAAQCVALWPGTSRSLVTILAGLAIGLSVVAAVEFSFLLGLVTLSAATVYDLLKHGSELFNTYGTINPLIGFVFAFAAAFIAVKWMVAFIEHRGLDIFGWYRIGIGILALVLLATNVI
jgi:undecaprenyl-diphosphatase